MILEQAFDVLYYIVLSVIGLLPQVPDMSGVGSAVGAIADKMAFGIWVVGPMTFNLVIANVVFWTGAHVAWSLVEWVYKKIPGVE